jgi:tetratricopeptide (TPR) repeat protein/tRNA A-37 threonylcarbamoyl transferase component Bud32
MSDLTTQLAQALGAAYRIERELGGGGMSRVFLAEEIALGRQVVIKVLPPEMAAGVNQDRFRREIQLAARLQHPHIVPLLSAGSAGDVLYYVMPFVEGESLRVKLAREGELPVTETVRILRDVLDALAYANDKGVVHRDIKPDNVMLSSGHALVTDFGVAKAVTESTGGMTLTSLGMALGTPAYMAPEQASGSPNVDHRADLYALGALAYEMLTGQPPFSGNNAQAVLAAHVTMTPATVTSHRPAVPPALEMLVMRCLEKHAADRFQRASELLPTLNSLLTPSGGTQPTSAVAAVSSGTEAALKKTHPVRVAVLFGLGAVVMLSLIWWLVQRLGLPDWVVLVASALLLIGLPIMLLAARQERRRIMERTAGSIPRAPTGLAGRLLSWRGAIAGGGLAFGGLVAGTALFMGLRMMGVGPFATLVSAGVLKERAPMIVADFMNRTSDSTLAASITEAFRIDLSQSPSVRLVGSDLVANTLKLMERDPGTPLSEQVAREVATRSGAKAVVAGEIAPLASGYVLSVRLVNAADGATLLAGREVATDAAAVIPAVERLSKKLREGIGESLRSIRAEAPLAEVTTSSLEALRLYTRGARASDAGNNAEAIRLLQQAVALDSGFAMAWRKLGVALGNAGEDRVATVAAMTHAASLKDRLPPREAALASAQYASVVLRDFDEEIRIYEHLLGTWPDDDIALTNLSIAYNARSRFADAAPLLQRLVDLGYRDAISLWEVVNYQMLTGRVAAAESTITSWSQREPGTPAVLLSELLFDVHRGQYDRALAEADSLTRSAEPEWRVEGNLSGGRILRIQGRLREATGRFRRGLAILEEQRLLASYQGVAAEMALAWAAYTGKPDSAAEILEQALARHPLDSIPPYNRRYAPLMATFSVAGRLDRAQALQSEYERVVPLQERQGIPFALFAEGQLALARGDPKTALDRFERARRLWRRCWSCTALDEGAALEQLGQKDSAVSSYERVTSTRVLFQDGWDLLALPVAHERLGELYEARGDRQKAIENYGKFADLWKSADPELQPRVKEARRRLATLTGEPTAKTP